jgi:tetratricopeptide (TPR) repeat protein
LEGVEPDVVVGGSIYLYEISRNAEAQRGLAEVYRRHGLQQEAEHALQRLLILRPFDGEARRTLLRAYLARGEDERIDALIMSSKNPDAWEMCQLAAARIRLGDSEGAEAAYDMGTRFFTHDPDLANEFAWFLQEMGEDLDRALQLADRAVEWSPQDPYYRDTRAMVNLKRGNAAAALADLDEGLSLPGGDLAPLHWHRALALVALGRSDEAVAAAERALVSEGLDDETAEEVMLWLSERGQ